MSENKVTKENVEHTERRASELSEDSAPSNPATQISDSTIQSSQISEASTSAGAPEISQTGSPSRYSILRRKVSSYFKNWGSKKDADLTESPKKSGLSVIDFVSSAVDVFRNSPEKTSLVDAELDSPPPPTKKKAEKEYYWKIDTFVDREGKPKTSGNLTDTTSLSTSDGILSPSTNEETSSAEESTLLKQEKSSKKDDSPV